MKQITVFLLFCACISSSIQAQLTSERNMYRSGDELQKQQVLFRDPGSRGKNLIWDFRHLQPVNQEYKLEYFSYIPENDSTKLNRICGMEHFTRYYYDQERDSIWAVGYENSTTYMDYVQPELRMVFPFSYGDTLYSEFEGKGEYGKRLKLKVKGFTHVEADAEGELILPDESIKKALRVRTLRHYTEIGRDSLGMILDTYAWYAAGIRYPVFESIKTTILNSTSDVSGEISDKTAFETSFYYPPIEQRLQIEEDSVILSIDTEPEGASAIFTEVNLLPNPVLDVLHIQYKLTRDAQITFSLHSPTGILMIRTTTQNQLEGYHSTQINMSGFQMGIYTLYVRVDDMVMSLNVIKI